MKKKLTVGTFFNKLLAGTATGIIIGLIPNAVLAAILKYVIFIPGVATLIQAGVVFQMATPLIIGALIAHQFSLVPSRAMVVAGATFVGSGVIQYQADTKTYIGAGTGDVFNIMITAALAVLVVLWIDNKFGSTEIILLPIVGGAGVGFLGMLLYPYVTLITVGIGNLINHFTDLQPMLMSILIAASFALLIISPITTVGIGLAIQLNGLSAGAAAMGIAATTMVLIVHSWRVNESGVTLAVALGGMKMFMPNLFRHPIIMLPVLFTAIISGLFVPIFNILGTPQSAGFGLVGLVGPLASLDAGLNIILMLVAWIVIPLVAAFVSKLLFEKTLHIYWSEEAFKFLG
ncbi:MAG: PTS sugar transporter subunit IIC [Aerococcus sp.]|nr:PTS sugar transporter subunit IIC [Aerococcus sp.]